MKAFAIKQPESANGRSKGKKKVKPKKSPGDNNPKSSSGQTEHIFECLPCSKTFKNKVIWKQHNNDKHSDKKRFACNECPFQTARKDSMEEHKRRHTGELAFDCSHCGKKFRHRRLVREHKIKNHPKEVSGHSKKQEVHALLQP